MDTIWQLFAPKWEREQLAAGRRRHRKRATRLSPSEIMTILIRFQQSSYRNFKGFYTQHVQAHQTQLCAEFPQLVSYTRFVALIPRVVFPLAVYSQTQLGTCTGRSFVDSTSLAVCHTACIARHHVFRVDARRGKTSVGWFYGFKLHLVVNARSEILAYCLTPGNVDDRRPLPRLVRRRHLFGKLLGNRGYLSQALAEHLFTTQGLVLITNVRKTMRERVLAVTDKLLLRKSAIIESVNHQLKNICQIKHSRHRSHYNFLVHLLVGLVAYCPQPKKPALHLEQDLDRLEAG